MGMASSQARLLMLTSRLHDVELKAQQLQNAKIQLATEEDEIYEEYQRALDATTLTLSTYGDSGINLTNIVATFNNTFSIGANTPAKVSSGNEGYLLVDNRGRVVVDDDIYEGYNEFINYTGLGSNGCIDNAYMFAMFMINGGIPEGSSIPGYDNGEWIGLWDNLNNISEDLLSEDETLKEYYKDALYTMRDMLLVGNPQFAVFYKDLGSLLNVIMRVANGGAAGFGPNKFKPATAEQMQVLNNLINYVFTHYSGRIFNQSEEDDEEYNMSDFNYYVRMYNAIQQHGGCISINDFDAPYGDVANNSEWLTAMIESGQMLIEKISFDKNGNANLDTISVASDTNFAFTTTSDIDKQALAKAEAKYEHDLKIVNRKDDKIDKEISNLETERNALTKEYDSIKKVASDNIERTFGIFS